jgi:hypothetical protein
MWGNKLSTFLCGSRRIVDKREAHSSDKASIMNVDKLFVHTFYSFPGKRLMLK